MEPFNIRINYLTAEVTLTILPSDGGYFKIVYYGGILGGLLNEERQWKLVPLEEVAAGDFPIYENKLDDERVELKLDESFALRIGKEIDRYLDKETLR